MRVNVKVAKILYIIWPKHTLFYWKYVFGLLALKREPWVFCTRDGRGNLILESCICFTMGRRVLDASTGSTRMICGKNVTQSYSSNDRISHLKYNAYLDGVGPGPVPGSHVTVTLCDSGRNSQVAVLAVHVVGAAP